MNTKSAESKEGRTDKRGTEPRREPGPERPEQGSKREPVKCGCDIDIRIEARGDVNIYNCCPEAGAGGGTKPEDSDEPCFPPVGACFPTVPGAKHKQSREYKLEKLANRVRVPSAIAASTIHLARRFLLGKSPANSLEKRAFALLEKIGRGTLSCTVKAFDAVPPRQRARLFAPGLILDPDQALDSDTLSGALLTEFKQRLGVQVFDDPLAVEEEQAGRVRVYEPSGEDFFSQVRICSINGIRTANFFPPLSPNDYRPDEVQQNCELQIVSGEPQQVCQVQTTDCPGHSLQNVICARVLDVTQGDGVVLEGVNFFNVNATVRILDKTTSNAVTEVDGFVRGDLETDVTEIKNGQAVLINDCRVKDKLTFQVPNNLAPGVYGIQVIVPNSSGIPSLGPTVNSQTEFINVLPSPTARFQVAVEWINARQETSPSWAGSDEVGLHTLAFPLFLDGTFGTDEQQRTEQKFEDIQDVEFDSGTSRKMNRAIFKHDQPILAMVMSVLGDEIDSNDAYKKQITSRKEIFLDLIKEQAVDIKNLVAAAGGIAAIAKFGPIAAAVAGAILIIILAYDIITALWAPADPIIRDFFALSSVDLATLASANAPIPPPRTFEMEDGIKVNVNKTVVPTKLPGEYHETREYVSDDEDSHYEVTYRFNQLA